LITIKVQALFNLNSLTDELQVATVDSKLLIRNLIYLISTFVYTN